MPYSATPPSSSTTTSNVQSQYFSPQFNNRPLSLLANSLRNREDVSDKILEHLDLPQASQQDKDLWKTCHRLFKIPSMSTMIDGYIHSQSGQTSQAISSFNEGVKALGQEVLHYYQTSNSGYNFLVCEKDENTILALLKDCGDGKKQPKK